MTEIAEIMDNGIGTEYPSYDAGYNRTSMSRDGIEAKLPAAFTNSAIYNAANRLTSFGGSTVLHDENGNMIQWGNKDFIWNAKNQLIEVKEDSSTIATFTYDVMGRRIEKTIHEGETSTTTKYLYDGADIVLEMNGSNVATAYYIHGPGMDEPLARVTLDSEGKVTGIRFYLADALGSIIALTDENGVVKTRYNYTPFGTVEIIGEASDNPFMYTGREWDGATGLYYYRARYYSPVLGRFISEDPIGLSGGINKYAYTSNSPVNAVDPWGLTDFWMPPPSTLNSALGIGPDSGPKAEIDLGSSAPPINLAVSHEPESNFINLHFQSTLRFKTPEPTFHYADYWGCIGNKVTSENVEQYTWALGTVCIAPTPATKIGAGIALVLRANEDGYACNQWAFHP